MGTYRHWLSIGLVGFLMLTISSVKAEGAEEAIYAQALTDQVWNIAHRGASGHAPELTLPAFELGQSMGADWIELDLHLTRDGTPVVIHDGTVDRTTDGKGAVKEYTLAELKQLDAGSWFGRKHPHKWHPAFQGLRIPTLEEVLRLKERNIRFSIEIKEGSAGPELEKKLVEILEKHRLLPLEKGELSRVMIVSFDRDSLKRIHRLVPQVPLIQLVHFREAGYFSPRRLRKIAAYADGIGYDYRRMEREDIRRAHRHGLWIHPYTVNQLRDLRRLIRWGADGIVTNYPDRLKQVLDNPKTKQRGEAG